MIARVTPLALLVLLLAFPAAAQVRHVVFVDNAAAEEGDGRRDHPVRTLALAQRYSHPNDIIYVAEGSGPYTDGLALKRGQLLIGAAFGLDALGAEFHIEPDSGPVPAAQGPGPLLRGTVTAAGDNVVAGCTMIADGAASLVAASPQGTLTLRDVWFRPSLRGMALSITEALGPVAISGGGMIGAAGGTGIVIAGGRGAITIQHFPISGEFGNAIFIGSRTAGSVKFGKGSPIRIADAVRDAIRIANVTGEVAFEDGLSIVTHGGRGLVIENSKKVTVAAGSKISATNAAAVNIFNSTVDVDLESVSAGALPPGKLSEGIGINAMHGRFVVRGIEKEGGVTGGTIRDAQAYGIRVEQSSGVRIANVQILESGAVPGKLQCPQDLGASADVVCRGGLFLRHVRGSQFDNVVVDGGSRNGLVANNVGELDLRNLDLRRSGALLQELSGTVAFNRCSFADGGGVTIEQRFNRARVTFDHCTFAAAAQPTASPFLLRARSTDIGTLAVELTNVEMHDTAGAAVDVVAAGTSSLSLSLSNAALQHLGGTVLTARATQTSHTSIQVHGARVIAPGTRDPLMQVTIEDEAAGCVDIAGNELTTDAATRPARLIVQSPKGRLSIANRDPAMVVEAPPGVVISVPSCR